MKELETVKLYDRTGKGGIEICLSATKFEKAGCVLRGNFILSAVDHKKNRDKPKGEKEMEFFKMVNVEVDIPKNLEGAV